jgi:hypothetical protein
MFECYRKKQEMIWLQSIAKQSVRNNFTFILGKKMNYLPNFGSLG